MPSVFSYKMLIVYVIGKIMSVLIFKVNYSNNNIIGTFNAD